MILELHNLHLEMHMQIQKQVQTSGAIQSNSSNMIKDTSHQGKDFAHVAQMLND
ncbi:hypothetical protein J5N97_018015 [Dioscorea zingiberensis]|uniref:Uncharacterized protein n=1 Tax=Dioscorea zingiberensis TaxID=325984 RepID=A0A9D5HGY3_9LILI|nr:hypothetical protein J5N97_018015 [Dioscorea zingiberensis]